MTGSALHRMTGDGGDRLQAECGCWGGTGASNCVSGLIRLRDCLPFDPDRGLPSISLLDACSCSMLSLLLLLTFLTP